MDYLDDEEEFAEHHKASRPSPVTIVSLLAAAGAAAMLLWMNIGLSSRVANLEEGISALKEPGIKSDITREMADISNQLDSVTQALANHLKSQAKIRNSQPSVAMRQSAVRQPIPQQNLSPQGLAGQPVLNRSIPAGGSTVLSNRSLPPPISSAPRSAATGYASSGWVVNITSVSDPESAYQEVQRLKRMGINAESARAFSAGRTWYRIRVPGFSSHDEAIAARPSLEARLGIRDTWVGRRE